MIKTVQDCVDEITKFPKVAHGDYKKLIALKSCLEMNYARLKGCNLEREINNTSCMKLIERKFPSAQQLKITKYLEELPEERTNETFVEFMAWLEKAGKVWASMESKGLSLEPEISYMETEQTLVNMYEGSHFEGCPFKSNYFQFKSQMF